MTQAEIYAAATTIAGHLLAAAWHGRPAPKMEAIAVAALDMAEAIRVEMNKRRRPAPRTPPRERTPAEEKQAGIKRDEELMRPGRRTRS